MNDEPRVRTWNAVLWLEESDLFGPLESACDKASEQGLSLMSVIPGHDERCYIAVFAGTESFLAAPQTTFITNNNTYVEE